MSCGGLRYTPPSCRWTMALIIPGIVLIYEVESTHCCLDTVRAAQLRVPCSGAGRRPWWSSSICISAHSSPPVPPASPRATCCGGPSAAVPSSARGSHIDCILHFLLWGRGESTLTRDQRVETLVNFCEVELDFEVLFCGLVMRKLTLSNRLSFVSEQRKRKSTS